ncbi:MAG: CDP-glucose 4,6-dehydratase [Acidimicrobiia bacterium]|nr:CDP-glucose 4,6-dehydratase [Acidimicrobiia bacterium]
MDIATWGSIYSGKRVLVTGHTGFKGSWLTLWLRRLGASVGGLALPATQYQQPLFEALGGSGALDYERLDDIRDGTAFQAAIREYEPDLVFHLAAQPLVRASYDAPVDTFATNTLGTAHVLEGLRTAKGVSGAVIVTTDKCYENHEQGRPFAENDAMGGHDPYSASKGAAEIITASYARSFFSAEQDPIVATARSGNVIGGGDLAPDRLIPDVIRAMDAGTQVKIRSPLAVRPWQHVLEPLAGYLELGSRILSGDRTASGGWNFGPRPGDVATVVDVLAIAEQTLGSSLPPIVYQTDPQPYEATTLSLDITKATSQLGWFPVFTNDDRVRMTFEWYALRAEGADALHQTSLDQLRSYEAAATTPSKTR